MSSDKSEWKRPQESRERMRESALARHERNALQTHERVRAMMGKIKEEMAVNNGIYPHNKGALSLAEVARRVEIHPLTFHKPRYVELGKEVKEWLTTLKQREIVSRTGVRKELGTRLQEWKQMYEDLLETHRLTETDLAVAQAKLDDALREIETLRQRVAVIAKQRVVSLRREGG